MLFSLQNLFAVALLLSAFSLRADDFILSYWCGPPATEILDQRYAEVAECNFNYAMLPCAGMTVQNNLATLDACKKHGLKYIVRDARILAFGPENAAFKTNLDAVISDYAKHSALGGYFITDEPGPALFPKLGAINQYLLEHDPKRLPFINLFPNYAPVWALGGTYEEHVEKYLTTVKPRLLCFDHYGLMTDDTVRPNYFENLEIIRRQSLKHEVPFGFIFQVTPHFSYRNPTEEDLRWQVNTALAYGAKALLHFTYWTPTNDPTFRTTDAIIDRKGNRSPHYEKAKRVNAAIKAWAPTLMKLRSTEVYHTGELPNATRALPKEAFAQVEGAGEFILGMFEHEDGSEWLIIVNRDLHQPVSATLALDKKIKGMRELHADTGRLSSVKMRHGEISLQFPAAGAKLFKLSR